MSTSLSDSVVLMDMIRANMRVLRPEYDIDIVTYAELGNLTRVCIIRRVANASRYSTPSLLLKSGLPGGLQMGLKDVLQQTEDLLRPKLERVVAELGAGQSR
ncbi:uncharacterized protein G6M90_00g096950 [Metarhizium brunneum]|uniref:Uncharacterized protein n=1 Tax=Metarhizium brunneum TaxID=500148 RepID=A0A7D5V3K2_9HYPO|nr:hypothetical protein G6M90_00g096950 [Metarhizium brunneum]